MSCYNVVTVKETRTSTTVDRVTEERESYSYTFALPGETAAKLAVPLAAVRARHTDSSPAQVEALKFNDGSGLLIVSAEDGKTLTRRTITTYRAIPLDENGMYCNKNGKYDFFLEVDTTKRRLGRVLLIGATYRFVFRTTDDERDYSSKTLLTKQRGAVGLNIDPQKES